ncbi:hypothetical protein TNCV_1321471 [Trichonephila clavipes]|nr:hypothetical protein TNCV_1321471 [Trichonephila clavipes]
MRTKDITSVRCAFCLQNVPVRVQKVPVGVGKREIFEVGKDMQVSSPILDGCYTPQRSNSPIGFLSYSTMDSMKSSPVDSPYCHHINPWCTSQHETTCHHGSNNAPTCKKLTQCRKHIVV